MSTKPPTQTIESLDLALGDVFTAFYVVPTYQREYVWEESQVEQLMQDVFDAFSDDGQSAEYFIGSMVVCPGEDGTLELIDGQQRMTTAYIFLCGVRDRLHELGETPIELLSQQIAAQDIDDLGRDVHRYRVDLQYEDSRGVLRQLAQRAVPAISHQERTRSVTNILSAYETIHSFIANNLKSPDQIRRFYAYFTKRVKIVRIKTHSVAHALKVFETINDRGVGLDAMDLLKNLLFMHAQPSDYDRLRDRWKKLVDILYSKREKPLRFLRYYIFARHRVDRLREDEIYDWFTDHAKECGYTSDPLGFVERLVEAAGDYAHFVSGDNTDGSKNRYLRNITFMSRAAKQHLILLLAGRHLSKEDFTELSRHIENLFFAYVITRENTREFERAFARWAPELMAVQTGAQLGSFIQARLAPACKELSQRFGLAFAELRQDSVPQYRLRYVVGKLTQYVDEAAYRDIRAAELDTYINPRVDVEHILPQTPTPELLAAFDLPDRVREFIPMLGNLCLLEDTIDSSVGNGTFGEKRVPYNASRFLLTKSVGNTIPVGRESRIDVIVSRLKTWSDWTSASILDRQQMLARLAFAVWSMPEPPAEG